MKVFTCNDFEGYYPVGTAAVIIAEDEEQARKLLEVDLQHKMLSTNEYTLKEIDMNEAKAIILCDGDY